MMSGFSLSYDELTMRFGFGFKLDPAPANIQIHRGTIFSGDNIIMNQMGVRPIAKIDYDGLLHDGIIEL